MCNATDDLDGLDGRVALGHEPAQELGRRKVAAILKTGAEAVASGNIGCLTQIQTHLARNDQPLPLFHTVNLLDLAYQR